MHEEQERKKESLQPLLQPHDENTPCGASRHLKAQARGGKGEEKKAAANKRTTRPGKEGLTLQYPQACVRF